MEDHRILARIVKDYPDALSDRKKLQALFSDFFPQDRLKRNILLMVFDDGITEEMQAATNLDTMALHRYVKSVSQGYGIKTESAEEAVLAWARAIGLSLDTEEAPEEGGETDSEVEWVEGGGENAYEYEETPRGIKLLRFIDFDDTVVTIPNMIGGKKVSEVGNHAFKGCVGIEKIVVSDGIEILGNGVFINCKELKEVVLPRTLRRIGTSDPTGCPKILGTMTKLEGTFEYTALEDVVIPDSVKYIGEYAFANCSRLQRVVLPDGLKEIRENTFCWCKSLREVVFPEELRVVGMEAFEGCEALQNVTLPEGVNSIEQGAFAGCRNLESIYIPDSVGEIGGGRGSGFIQTFGEPDDRHQNFTILCNAGSYAMNYARKQQIKCAKAQN
ncbi:MAG: leucine-rich repeat domain-containing protein [Lachnospiraceae bacterium]|nr:leucine-rich repeat domain-containing protein [Lachnospiraceae bacterium]